MLPGLPNCGRPWSRPAMFSPGKYFNCPSNIRLAPPLMTMSSTFVAQRKNCVRCTVHDRSCGNPLCLGLPHTIVATREPLDHTGTIGSLHYSGVAPDRLGR